MKQPVITTPCANVYWYEEDYIILLEFTNLTISLEEAKHHQQIVHDTFVKDNDPILSISVYKGKNANIRKVNKDVRAYFASDINTKTLKAAAIIANNFAERLLGNIYLAVNKPLVPTKLFKELDKAADWLKSLNI